MSLWRRLFGRPQGRHALGAAVRSLPVAAASSSWASAPAAAPLPPAPRFFEPAAPEAPPVLPAGPRGELTFRDGSTAELDPVQARELADIASILTQRDGVKH